MNKIKLELPESHDVRHPYWGKTSYTYDETLGKGFGCLEGGDPFSFESTEEDAEDVFIQCLDDKEKDDRLKRFKHLLKSTLNEFEGLVHQGSTKGSEELVAKAQLAQKISDLLDLDL